MEQDEKQMNEEQPDRDEMDDLEVSEQQAEDVKGGARYGRFPRPRGE